MSADSAAPANIMIAIDSTAFWGLKANSSEEMMPLPYWKEPSAKNNHDRALGVEIHSFYAHLLARPQASPLRLRARHEHLSTRSRGGGGSTINRCQFRYAHRQTEPDAVITSSPDPPLRALPLPTHASRTQENAHARAL